MHLGRRIALLSFIVVAAAAGGFAPNARASELRSAVADACAAAGKLPGLAPQVCEPAGVERRHIAGDVFEYSFKLKVGRGPRDLIGIHRVVRERSPGVARRTEHAVFMVHGDLWGFDAAFLGSALSANVPREQSIGAYLAGRDVDVWGIDLRWVNVPAETADFTFMKDWNIRTHVRDIAAGVGVARAVRALGGSGAGKVALLGWSRGGILAYAYANEEARLPERLRQVKALVPVDIAYKFDAEHEEQRLGACRRYEAGKQLLDLGRYHSDQGVGVGAFGLLASANPAGQSPIPGFEGFTNAQAALLVGSATHLLLAPNPPVPAYHFTAGLFDGLGVPVGLQFTREAYFNDFLQAAEPFQSFAEQVESDAITCGDVDVPYDDRLGEINVPVMYVGAEGGFGRFGTDTLARLGSADVTAHVVQLYPAEARAVEFGHADLFLADNARELVWAPLHGWLVSH